MLKQVSAVLAGLSVAALAAAPALAVTVTNQSDKAHEITVDRGDDEPKVKIEPGQSAKVDCGGACELRNPAVISYGLTAQPGDKAVIGKDNQLAFQEGAAKERSKTN